MLPHLLGLPTFALALVFGLVLAWKLAAQRVTTLGWSRRDLLAGSLLALVAAVLGGRIWFLAAYGAPQGWLQGLIGLDTGGLVLFGAVLGVAVAVVPWARSHRWPLPVLLDLICPPLLIALAFGRLGCLANGCCYGHASDLPWAFCTHGPVPRHPVQLYEALFTALWGSWLYLRWPRRRHDGRTAGLACLGYGGWRILAEQWRGDVPGLFTGLGLHWSGSALFALGLMVVGTVLLIRSTPCPPRTDPLAA